MSNYWRFLHLHLINCEIELDLSWSKNCIISEISITFSQINNAKFYIPIVALFINDDIKFSENIKQKFKRIISWNKYRS